ncbi:MAG: hypothetical protein GXO86_04870, partial [Chlorobi bacterium]|nr:hypothetical protein [Chlorobiota bacterium]
SYRFDRIKSTDAIFLKIIPAKNRTDYIYSSNPASDTVFAFSFFVYKETDSIINIFNKDCPLVKTKNYKIKGKNYCVRKYYYDEENSFDEESSIFYNENYGLLVYYNDGWSTLINTLYYDEISLQLVDSILNDKSGFYKQIPPPPPKIKNELK